MNWEGQGHTRHNKPDEEGRPKQQNRPKRKGKLDHRGQYTRLRNLDQFLFLLILPGGLTHSSAKTQVSGQPAISANVPRLKSVQIIVCIASKYPDSDPRY